VVETRAQLIRITVTPDGKMSIQAQGNLTQAEVILALEMYKLSMLQKGIHTGEIAGLNVRQIP
jgi:hypothetical protein